MGDRAVNSKPNLIDPETDKDFFAIGRLLLSRSTCLKTQTAALIVANGVIVSYGINMCCPQDQLYGLPVAECPRLSKETGTYYELCKPIHAEIVAAINAFGISHIDRKTLWHFPGFTLKLKHYEGFFKNKDAKLYLLGHYWACQECIDFLKLIGITEIKFDDLSGGKTLQEYKTKDLTGRDHAVDVSGCIVEGIVTVRIAAKDLADFCARQNVNLKKLHPFGVIDGITTEDFYLVEVDKGNEHARAELFKKDPAVKETSILLFRKIA